MWLDLSAVELLLQTQFVGRRLVYLTNTTSTMDIARREARDGAGDGTVVLAEEQTAGRGRFGRSWVSPAGKNLYLTLVLRPDAIRLRALSIVAPLAVSLALETVTGLEPGIKWPNDVLYGGRKLAGILIETEFSGADPEFSLVGIGLNVNFDIPADSEIAGLATSVKQELGREVSRAELLASLLNHFEASIAGEQRGGSVHLQWKKRLETLGQRVTVTFQGQIYEGLAEDVDREGNLILRCDDGSLLTVEAGEVTLRHPSDDR
jgi:BirA family transcriptional regulator, biotin operon repressor / biotin---[acetyl-CoA-carboxylase] ligase